MSWAEIAVTAPETCAGRTWQECSAAGIDGFIIVDLPVEESWRDTWNDLASDRAFVELANDGKYHA